MDLSRTVYAVIGVLVAVLIVATVALPVVDNAQNMESTKFNNSISNRYIMDVDAEVDFSTSFLGSASSYEVNGQTFTRTPTGNYILISDLGIVLENGSSNSTTTITSSSGSTSVSSQTISIVLNEGNLTVKVDDQTLINGAASWVAIPDVNGTHIASTVGEDRYLNGVDDVVAAAYSDNGGYVWCHFGETSAGATLAANGLQSVEGYDDLFTAKGVILQTANGEISPYYWLVPSEVSAHSETDNAHIALLGATMMLLFLVPVMMVVRMIAGRSD